MTKKDFFVVIIKLFGLFSLITSIFSVLPSNISFALFDIDMASIIWITITVMIILALFVLLIFQAEKVVRVLRLDKGFDDSRIEFGNLTSADIIKIGTFVIGGLMILNNIPVFLSHSLFAFKAKNVGIEYHTDDSFNWAVSGVNLIVGFLLLTNYAFVAEKLKTKSEHDQVTLH